VHTNEAVCVCENVGGERAAVAQAHNDHVSSAERRTAMAGGTGMARKRRKLMVQILTQHIRGCGESMRNCAYIAPRVPKRGGINI
jgi:hypothetical protein